MAPRMTVIVCVFTLALYVNFTSCAGDYQQCRAEYPYDKYYYPVELKIEATFRGECTWYFRVPEGKFPEVVVTMMDIGHIKYDFDHPIKCMDDKLWFRTGTGDFIGHPLCGKTSDYTTEQLTRRSTTTSMFMHFSNIIGHFEAQFKIVDTPGKSVCPTEQTELQGSGTINFAFDPYHDAQEIDCVWVIRASPGKNAVRLDIKKMFASESCSDGPHLQVYFNQWHVLCNDEGTAFVFVGPVIAVAFHHRKPYTATKFEIDFASINV